MGWVVDVEIGAGGRPANGDGVLEGEEREAVGGDFAHGAGDGGAGLESGVEVRTSGADEDEEGKDLGDEGPSGGNEVSSDWRAKFGFEMDVSLYLSYT